MRIYESFQGSAAKVCLLVIFLFSGIILYGCNPKSKYGLVSDHGYFFYSYFVSHSELFVKNMREFEKQFGTKEYEELQKAVNEAKDYMQSEVIYLPVVQRIIPGNKHVFVFETKKEDSDHIIKRLAFECDQVKDLLAFPTDCKGYFMEYGSDFPPILKGVTSGQLKIKQKDSKGVWLVI